MSIRIKKLGNADFRATRAIYVLIFLCVYLYVRFAALARFYEYLVLARQMLDAAGDPGIILALKEAGKRGGGVVSGMQIFYDERKSKNEKNCIKT